MGSYTLLDPTGLTLITGTLHSFGDAERAARQWRLRVGWVEDAQGWRGEVVDGAGRVVGTVEQSRVTKA